MCTGHQAAGAQLGPVRLHVLLHPTIVVPRVHVYEIRLLQHAMETRLSIPVLGYAAAAGWPPTCEHTSQGLLACHRRGCTFPVFSGTWLPLPARSTQADLPGGSTFVARMSAQCCSPHTTPCVCADAMAVHVLQHICEPWALLPRHPRSQRQRRWWTSGAPPPCVCAVPLWPCRRGVTERKVSGGCRAVPQVAGSRSWVLLRRPDPYCAGGMAVGWRRSGAGSQYSCGWVHW